jgi:chitodextrinase
MSAHPTTEPTDAMMAWEESIAYVQGDVLHEAAKAFYNATAADKRVTIKAYDDESRDRIHDLAEALRAALVANAEQDKQ